MQKSPTKNKKSPRKKPSPVKSDPAKRSSNSSKSPKVKPPITNDKESDKVEDSVQDVVESKVKTKLENNQDALESNVKLMHLEESLDKLKKENEENVKDSKSHRGHKKKSDNGGGVIKVESDVEGDKEGEELDSLVQPQHMPHLPTEVVAEPQYLAKLQAISAAISSPLTDQVILNSIVDIILETGNFAVRGDSFDFDLCNLDKQSVNKISVFLKLEPEM